MGRWYPANRRFTVFFVSCFTIILGLSLSTDDLLSLENQIRSKVGKSLKNCPYTIEKKLVPQTPSKIPVKNPALKEVFFTTLAVDGKSFGEIRYAVDGNTISEVTFLYIDRTKGRPIYRAGSPAHVRQEREIETENRLIAGKLRAFIESQQGTMPD